MRPAIALVFLLGAPGAAALAPRRYTPLPVGSVTPRGWLLAQLKLQADGLSGHLSQFWGDVMDSVWIGGSADGGLHERVPYWLNGIVPLAYLLRNAGVTALPPVVGIYKKPWGRHAWLSRTCADGVDMPGADLPGEPHAAPSAEACRDDCANAAPSCWGYVYDNCTGATSSAADPQGGKCWLKASQGATVAHDCRCYGKLEPEGTPVDVMAQAERYVSYILDHQGATGWLGPDTMTADPSDDAPTDSRFSGAEYWGPSNVLQALYQYAEGAGTGVGANHTRSDAAARAVLLHMLEMRRRLHSTPLDSWAKARWLDLANTAESLIDHVELDVEQRAALDELIQMLHAQVRAPPCGARRGLPMRLLDATGPLARVPRRGTTGTRTWTFCHRTRRMGCSCTT